MNKKTLHVLYIISILGLPGMATNALAQLGLPQVPGGLRDLPTDIDRRVRTRAERTAEQAADEAQQAAEASQQTTDAVDETIERTASTGSGAIAAATGQVAATVNAVKRPFVAATDANAALIEANVVVALVSEEQRDEMRRAGFDIISERSMAALGKTFVTLRQPAGTNLAEAISGLRTSFPETAIDYNHLYRYDQAETNAIDDEVSASDDIKASAPGNAGSDSAKLRVGVIDSAVLALHPALEGVRVVGSDFVSSEHARPLTHGTAVSSLISRSAGGNVDIYSASVFFQVPGHAPGASTEGLVAALDWLVSEDVDVINMSLSGPGNELLEVAVNAVAAQDKIIVAAVGNNGPAGEPLYPGAYDSVIGVTAVDRDHRIFRNANRGDHVDYAAVGVNVKVADSTTGGFTIASGTSMASPHVAVVVAKTLREGGAKPDALQSWLMASAKDLGRKGFDPVYGHGLITQPPAVVSNNQNRAH